MIFYYFLNIKGFQQKVKGILVWIKCLIELIHGFADDKDWMKDE